MKDTEGPKQKSASSLSIFRRRKDSPPAYDQSFQVSEEDVEHIVAAHDIPRPDNWPHEQCHYDDHNLIFTFRDQRFGSPTWQATLRVWAPNITQLMRDGFFWSTANLDLTQGRLHLKDRAYAKPDGLGFSWNHSQRFELQSLPGDDAKWWANLYVHTKSMSDMLRFRPTMITLDTIREVRAYGQEKRLIYVAKKSRGRRGLFCNTLFGDRPMEGWWPAPKKDGEHRPKGW